MTVKELVEKLLVLNQDAEVTIPYESGVLLVDDEEQTEIVFYKP